jgi:hypothetical protein|tara:strand:+ start:1654 stop:1869 length:216 start_codon:yes stop_codon:yes gene_type:complete
MAENKESNEFLGKLAMIADASQSLIEGKVSVVIEVYQQEFEIIKQNFAQNTAEDRFKVEISDVDFIFILDK